MVEILIKDLDGNLVSEAALEAKEIVIGRVEDSDIVLAAPNVSRRHARIFRQGENICIEDMGSANGVIVDGVRIHEAAAISLSAKVRIGDYLLSLNEVQPPPESQPSLEPAKLRRLATGEEFDVSAAATRLGRAENNEVVVVDKSISRNHAQVAVGEFNVHYIEDLQSANGTFVNGRRVDRARIIFGDRIRLGTVEFVFMAGRPKAAPPARAVTARPSLGLNLPLFLGGVASFLLAMVLVLLTGSSPEVSYQELIANRKDFVEQKVSEARQRLASRQWKEAAALSQEVLDVDPFHVEGQAASLKAQEEMMGERLIQEIREALQRNRADEAWFKLRQVPAHTVAQEKVQLDLPVIQRQWRERLLLQAGAACQSNDIPACERALWSLMDLDGRDEQVAPLTKVYLDQARVLLQAGYPDEGTRRVIETYLTGALPLARKLMAGTTHPSSSEVAARIQAVEEAMNAGEAMMESKDLGGGEREMVRALIADRQLIPATLTSFIRHHLTGLLADSLSREGQRAMLNNRLRDAYIAWSAASRYDPTYPPAKSGLVELSQRAVELLAEASRMEQEQKLQEAISRWQLIIDITPREDQSHILATARLSTRAGL